MAKQEFLQELRAALQGEVSQSAINEHLRYYDSYITEEARKGKSEEEVVSMLGSPRLIAKTLIDTSEQFGSYGGQEKGYREESAQGRAGTSGGFEGGYPYQGRDGRPMGRGTGVWYRKLVLALAAVVIVIALANVVAFLLPLLVPIILVVLIYTLIFGGRR